MSIYQITCERLETDPYLLNWRVRKATKFVVGSKSHVMWCSLDMFDEKGRLSGYLGDYWISEVVASNPEKALELGISRVMKRIDPQFYHEFTHLCRPEL